MYFWAQTNTGLLKVRNAADTAWVDVGDTAQPYLGQLSTQGGNMNGAISGAHGLASAGSQDFSGTIRQQGALLALKTYVDSQIATVNASIATAISSSLASIPALNVSSKIAFARGTWTGTGTVSGKVIDVPKYSDGIWAAESECLWGVSFLQQSFGFYPDKSLFLFITETANRVYKIENFRADSYGAGHAQDFGWAASWWILAIRKG
jgi:hypothetical protein